MYEYLKSLFVGEKEGETVSLTFEQLVEKLNGNKEIKLANLAEGGYVSKEKFDSTVNAKDIELDGVKKQLSDANETIQSYKDMDIDGIKQSAKDWETKYNDETKALNEKLLAQERAHNEDMFLSGYKFSSKAAAEGVKAEFIKKNFPFENGVFLGAKEFMEQLKGDEDYKAAFVVETEPNPNPNPDPQPPKPQFSDPNPNPNPKPQKKGLAELMQMKNENPNAQIEY